MIRTKGEVEVIVKGKINKFQLVSKEFRIDRDGILGIEFLRFQEATLKFKNNSNGELIIGKEIIPLTSHTTVTLPPRQKTLITLSTKETKLKSGYVKRIDVGPEIYIGEAIVTPKDGTVQLFAINSTPENIELTIPSLELEDYDVINLEKLSLNKVDPFSEKSVSHAKRMYQITKLLDLKKLNDEEKDSLLKLVYQFPYQFHLPTDKLGMTEVVSHKIVTTDEKVINVKQYRYPQIHKEEIRNQVLELRKNNIICPSKSPFNSPLWIVPKKADSKGRVKWRMVIDYRGLNEKTVSNAYPIPHITDILDQLGGAKYFSTLDLASGFHQISMHPESQHMTAFSTPFGHYEFKKMPFGLKNAPSTFQRFMDQVLSGLQGIELFVYMDDIVVYSSSLEEHSRKLKTLLGRLQTAGLSLQPDKCFFLERKLPISVTSLRKTG